MWIIIFCLKIIGVVLLIALLVLMLAVMYLLFAPFTYSGIVLREDGKLGIWLVAHDWLSIGRIKAGYGEGRKQILVRLLWGLIQRNSLDHDEGGEAEKQQDAAGDDETKNQPVEGDPQEQPEDRKPDDSGEEAVAEREQVLQEPEGAAEELEEEEQADDANQSEKLDTGGKEHLESTGESDKDGVREEDLYDADIELEEPREPDQKIREPRPPRETGGSAPRIREPGRLAKIKQIISHPGNKRAMLILWRGGIKILCRIRPHFEEADTVFALGEPDLTGELLGVISMCPSVYNARVSISPDFESDSPYIEGQVTITGNLQLYYIVAFGLRLLLSRDCRRLYRQVRHL